MKRFLKDVVDFFLPRRCPGCGRELSQSEEMLCVRCWMNLDREGVGNSEDEKYWSQNEHIMAWVDFPFLCRAGAFVRFKRRGVAAHLIHNVKYYHYYETGIWMGRLMARELQGKGLLEGTEVIVPIPITRWRSLGRGFNQSEMIASGLSEIMGLPVLKNALRCTGHKESHTHMSIEQRKQILYTEILSETNDTKQHTSFHDVSFALNAKQKEHLRGKHILLVDDVITTGNTIRRALTTLSQIEDIKVTVLAWAWV